MTHTILDNSLPNLIAKRIAEQILNGKLSPGSPLREGEFSIQFGTSRAPIREAFYLLEIDGLVKRVPRRGTFVKGYSASEMYNLFELRIAAEQLALKRFGEIQDLSDVRKRIAPLERTLESMKEVKNNETLDAYSDLNTQFHHQVIQLAGSEVLDHFYARMGTPLNALIRISFLSEISDIERSFAEHQELLQLLQKKDIVKAGEVLGNHNQFTIRRLEKYFSNKGWPT